MGRHSVNGGANDIGTVRTAGAGDGAAPVRFATAVTPDGPFTIIASGAVLASGWTEDVGALLALIHPSLRPSAGELEQGGAAPVLAPSAVRLLHREGGVAPPGGPGGGLPPQGGVAPPGGPGGRLLPQGGGRASGPDGSEGCLPPQGEGWDESSSVLARALCALERYYCGDHEAPAGVPVTQRSGPFRQEAWNVLRDVPPGTVLTYTEYARRCGRPRAVRAAAGACAANAAALFVPCHRVVRADAALGGFRYGLAVKRALLERESR